MISDHTGFTRLVFGTSNASQLGSSAEFAWQVRDIFIIGKNMIRLLSRGGEQNEKNQLFGQPQVNSIVIPIYKNGEKRIFDHWVHLNPPHLTSKLLILGHFLHFSPLSVRVF